MSAPDPFTRRLNQRDVYERHVGADAETFKCWWGDHPCKKCYPDPDVARKKRLYLPRCFDHAEMNCLGEPRIPPSAAGVTA